MSALCATWPNDQYANSQPHQRNLEKNPITILIFGPTHSRARIEILSPDERDGEQSVRYINESEREGRTEQGQLTVYTRKCVSGVKCTTKRNVVSGYVYFRPWPFIIRIIFACIWSSFRFSRRWFTTMAVDVCRTMLTYLKAREMM